MPRRTSGQITQRRIAELAGVSQSTVSLVLNGRSDGSARIPQETRDRILRVIQDTAYVADPSARRLAGAESRIFGVFTYEPAFPTESADFYTPLLAGIEAAAESRGIDLLLFTSAPVAEDGRRELFRNRNRLRIADGVLLLGVEMDADDLAQASADGFPVVAVGRRDAPGIPFVGVDYVGATRTLLRRAADLGHRQALFLHRSGSGESVLDRRRGVREGAQEAGLSVLERPSDGTDADADWAAVREAGVTLVIAEEPEVAAAVRAHGVRDGVAIPEELSIVALGSAPRTDAGPDITRLTPPRPELGAAAVELLARLISGETVPPDERRTLLPCPIADGATLSGAAV